MKYKKGGEIPFGKWQKIKWSRVLRAQEKEPSVKQSVGGERVCEEEEEECDGRDGKGREGCLMFEKNKKLRCFV